MRRFVAVVATFVLVAVASPITTSAFPSGGALPPVQTLDLMIAGVDGVPIDAVGVALNVTVTSPAAAGFLTVYPCGVQRPTASNLNYVADQTVPNFVIAALSPDGDVCIDTFAVVDVVVDLAGYLPAGSPVVTLSEPTRVVDSRIGVGLLHRLAASDTAAVQITGNAGVPADASMVLVNTTAVDTGAPGFLTVFPCGESVPPTSTLNYGTGAIVPNFVLARIGDRGQVCVFTQSPTDVVMDIAGYVPAGVGEIVPLSSPDRLLDTRFGIGVPSGPFGVGEHQLRLAGVGLIPPDAAAVVVNLTATRAVGNGFVTAYPCGTEPPVASNLNVTPGANVANMAIVRLGVSGSVCFVTNTAVDVIADVSGYLTGDTAITAVSPVRIYDSREGIDPQCNLGVRATPTSIEIVDLQTGAVVGSAPLAVQSPRAHVRSDCQHIDLVGDVPPLFIGGWVLDRSGAIVQAYTLDNFAFGVLFTSQGPLMVDSRPPLNVPGPTRTFVEDAITHAVLFSLPGLDAATDGGFRFWRPVGVTDDLSLLAFWHDSLDRGTQHVVSYWTLGGVQLGEAVVNGLPTGLSTLGSYISYEQGTGSITGDMVVATLGGVEVTRLHQAVIDQRPVWMSDGATVFCQPDARSLLVHQVRWDLFSPPRPAMPGDPFQSCLLDAR